mmetsp:Transcript_7711/g.15613  ORF Transcript_7711/g.15613 Transcript_7711/m.15613 type:complete len:82 (+) Transcript_7711:2982-3227(+)
MEIRSLVKGTNLLTFPTRFSFLFVSFIACDSVCSRTPHFDLYPAGPELVDQLPPSQAHPRMQDMRGRSQVEWKVCSTPLRL